MTNYLPMWIALGIAGFATAAFGGTFTWKEADHKLLPVRGILEWDVTPRGMQTVQPPMKTPEGLFEAEIKSYSLKDRGAAPMILLAKSNADAKMIDRAVFDANANSDFADDPVLTLNPEKPLDVKYQPNEREAVDYRLYLVKSKRSDGWDVALLPKLWREGTLTLDGKPVRALIRGSSTEAKLIPDMDGDGEFNFNSADQFPLALYMTINISFYKAVQGATDDELSIELFNGPFGKLEISGEMIPPAAQDKVSLIFAVEPGATPVQRNTFSIQSSLANQPFSIPAGEYTIRHGLIEGADPLAATIFNMDNNIILSPEFVTKLVLNTPRFDLTVGQQGRTLRVEPILGSSSSKGISYNPHQRKLRDKGPLVVDVVDPANPAKVLIGPTNLAYGQKNSLGRTTMSIPPEINPGQKVLVRLQMSGDENRIVKEFVVTGIADGVGTTSKAADLSPFAEGDKAKRARLAVLEANADTPPEINLKDWINRAPTNLAGLKGKIVVLDFWATWCRPCVAAIPKNNALMDKFADQVVIIGVCHPSTGMEKLADVVKNKGIKYPVAVDADGAAAKAYALDGYPDYYLIDQTGKLRLADCSNGSVEDAIKALLDAKQETDQKP